ncbi:MAG: hypothetical protein WA807_09400 [Steroidobacteraceae bacterium]
MQGECLAAAGGQAIQIETARPALIPFQRVLLGVVAEIPDQITGARLRVQQTGEGFDAVSIDQHHWPKLICSSGAGKNSKLRETLNKERHFLPGLNSAVSVPEI